MEARADTAQKLQRTCLDWEAIGVRPGSGRRLVKSVYAKRPPTSPPPMIIGRTNCTHGGVGAEGAHELARKSL